MNINFLKIEYHVGYVEPFFDQIFGRFYRDVISPYFPAGARLVDERYETITMPGELIEAAYFFVSAAMNLLGMLQRPGVLPFGQK
jgi:hypothetical protein